MIGCQWVVNAIDNNERWCAKHTIKLTHLTWKEIRLINRTRERATSLAHALDGPVTVLDWDKRHSALEGAALETVCRHLGPSLELGRKDPADRGAPMGAVKAPGAPQQNNPCFAMFRLTESENRSAAEALEGRRGALWFVKIFS